MAIKENEVMMRASAFVVLVLGWSTGAVYAQTVDVKDLSIQMGPVFIKFQARVSQANLPVGDAVFQGVTVNLYDQSTGGHVICTENLMNTNGGSQIPVTNGILNVEIGRNMSCPSGKSFHEEVARRSPMYLEIALITKNSEGISITSILSPRIQFGTVPYAIKANYAVRANDAKTAQIAAQSLYAHRASADPDVENAQSSANGYSGANGYFDFATPAEETAVGGHVVWTPNLGADNSLTIASGLPDNNRQLDNFTIKSNHTLIDGYLEVTNGIKMEGSIDKAKELVGENQVTRNVEDIIITEMKLNEVVSKTQHLDSNINDVNATSVAYGNDVQENNSQNNCACFSKKGIYGYRRLGKPCNTNSIPFACSNPSQDDWKITTTNGKWSDGFSACQQFGAGYNFASPKNSREDAALFEMLGSVDTVWINLNDNEHEGYWVSGDSIAVRLEHLERATSQLYANPSENTTQIRGKLDLFGGETIYSTLEVRDNIATTGNLNASGVNANSVTANSVTAKQKLTVTGDIQTSANVIVGGEIRGKIDGTYIKKGTASVPWFRLTEVTIPESTSIPRIVCTNYSSTDYYATIASFDVKNGDVNENGRNGVSIFRLRTTTSNGYICVEGNFKSDGAEEEIWVQLLLINRNLFIGG